MRIRNYWLAALIVVAVTAALLFALRRPITLELVRHQVHEQLAHSWFQQLPDGLYVLLCGAGGPMPDPQRAGPCTVVIAGQHVFVVDAGPGSIANILRSGIPIGQVEAAFLTHFHSDHIGALGELMLQRWVNGRHQQPLPVYGPPGTAEVVAGFNQAYQLDAGYRTAHHGPKIAPPEGAGGIARPFATPAPGEGLVVLSAEGLTVTAFRVDHGPVDPAVGYRFDYRDRSVVISGDTLPTANLVRFAKGADLLIHEALSPKLLAIVGRQAKATSHANLAQIMHDVINYHSTPRQAAMQAKRAGVGALLLNHITPPLPIRPLQGIFLDGVDKIFQGQVELGHDGTWVALPAGSDAIEFDSRL